MIVDDGLGIIGKIVCIGLNFVFFLLFEVWIYVNIKFGYWRSDWYFKVVRVEY